MNNVYPILALQGNNIIMISKEKAQEIAHQWIQAWNEHKIDDMISLYSEDIVFTSPYVVEISGNQSGSIKGKKELRAYFVKALQEYPNLKFELLSVLIGVDIITILYKSVNDLPAAATISLDSDYKIVKYNCAFSA